MPQPVDFPSDVSRTLAAERVQSAIDRSALAAQQRASQELEDKQSQVENSVHETPEAQSEEVDEELKRRAQYDERRRRKKKNGQAEADESPRSRAPGEGEKLDVRV